MAIFMKAGDLKGSVDTEQYRAWILIDSFNFGAEAPVDPATASGANRQGTHASVTEINLTKQLDPTSVYLWMLTLTSKHLKQVDLAMTRADHDNSEYLHIRLWDVRITKWQMGANSHDRPSETLSVNFTKVELKETEQSVTGANATVFAATFDLAKQKLA